MKRFIQLTAAVWAVFLGSVPVHAEADHGGHAQGESFSAGEPGDLKKSARIIQVTMTEAERKMLFARNKIKIKEDDDQGQVHAAQQRRARP